MVDQELADFQDANYFAEEYGENAAVQPFVQGRCGICLRNHVDVDLLSGFCAHCLIDHLGPEPGTCQDLLCPFFMP